MQKYCAVAAGAALAFTLGGTALGQGSVNIDFSGFVLGPVHAVLPAFFVDAPGQIVTNVDWSFTYTAGAAVGTASWTEELSIELVAPGMAMNPVIPTGTGGTHPGNLPDGGFGAFNPGTFVWGTPDGWSPLFTVGAPGNSHNLGGTSSTGTITSMGTTDAFNGMLAHGDWIVSLFDSFDDGAQGAFSTARITIRFIPAPGALALLGIAGLAGTTRRRRN